MIQVVVVAIVALALGVGIGFFVGRSAFERRTANAQLDAGRIIADAEKQAETAKQAAILNALPAHIALLDTTGNIVSVNEAWRRFALENALHYPEHGVGVNYLDVCDNAHGNNAAEARGVAAGIRRDGRAAP